MGLARDLTMGTQRRRYRGAGRMAVDPSFTELRALTKVGEKSPLTADALQRMRRLIETVGARVQRMRFEEGATFNAACRVYREQTGETIGPETGVI